MTIRIIKPSIDDYENTVVIRGIVDTDSLSGLKIDFYQRELLPSKSRKEIRRAILAGERLPDIELGMRGDRFEMAGNDVVLNDDVFIIDGRQRRDTILECCQDNITVRLGAVIHLNTTADWERERFHKLNLFQSKVSPNILLRNNKEDHVALTTMYGLTKTDRQGIMYNKVCWQQSMLKGELITANTMLATLMSLHTHQIGAYARSIRDLVPASDRLIEKIGLPIFRDNVKSYFNLIDECWGIKRVTLKGGAPYLKSSFMGILARLLSDHPDFWKQPDDRRLQVPYAIKHKLAKFPISDPEIVRLASAHGAARYTMYLHLINWINSGKRHKKLISRNATVPLYEGADTGSEDEAEQEVA